MEDLTLNTELEQEIFGLRRQASACFREKDFSGIVNVMTEAWEKLPEPKTQYGESFLIARMMCEAALGLNDLQLGEKWVGLYKVADLSRIDSGERIFMEARLSYAKKDFDKAKELFGIADRMSDGRLFQNADAAEYYKFYKEK